MLRKSINRSLLLIENDRVDEMAMLRVLAKEEIQYTVTVARRLSEARHILSEYHFDIVIADYDLPDGYAFELEDKLINQVVIFITGAGSEEVAARAFKLGISDYLIKDHERNYLRLLPNRIDAVIQQKHLTSQLNERLKEMTCLYNIRHNLDLSLSIKDISKAVMENLMKGMQFPELTGVLFKFDDKQFVSSGYDAAATPELNSEIKVNKEVRGQLCVRYAKARSFLIPEEQNLIDAIAKDLGWWFERKEYDENLRIAATALETSQGIVITDSTGKILKINSAFERITQHNREEICDKHLSILQLGDGHNQLLTSIWEHIENKGSWSGEIDIKREDSFITLYLSINAVINSLNEATHLVGVFQDITKSKLDERKIHSLSFYDSLTNLPNKNLLINQLNEAISLSKVTGNYNAILLIDIDHLKALNDLFGNKEGDRFLIAFGNRLRFYASNIAHIGSDEFALLLENIDQSKEVALISAKKEAEKILNELNIFKVEQTEYHYSLSIGIHIFSGHDSSDNVMKDVEAAMYQAKDLGGNKIHFYNPILQQLMQEHIHIEVELHQALREEQLQLYYQIQVNNNNQTIGAEALIRWNHPQRGLISPLQFIPIAEKSSLILEIGQWIIDTACRQLSAWSERADTNRLSVAINISNRQFYEESFVARIATAIRSHCIDPALLKLELTESIVMYDAIATEKIGLLRELGTQLSLDDFGTGYSSLSYLRQLDVDQLKIDQSFVRSIVPNTSDGVIAKTIINLAHNFHLNIIAEGVETEYQLAFLKENGCKVFQGYLFGKPLPIEEMESLLDKYPPIVDKPIFNIPNYTSIKYTCRT